MKFISVAFGVICFSAVALATPVPNENSTNQVGYSVDLSAPNLFETMRNIKVYGLNFYENNLSEWFTHIRNNGKMFLKQLMTMWEGEYQAMFDAAMTRAGVHLTNAVELAEKYKRAFISLVEDLKTKFENVWEHEFSQFYSEIINATSSTLEMANEVGSQYFDIYEKNMALWNEKILEFEGKVKNAVENVQTEMQNIWKNDLKVVLENIPNHLSNQSDNMKRFLSNLQDVMSENWEILLQQSQSSLQNVATYISKFKMNLLEGTLEENYEKIIDAVKSQYDQYTPVYEEFVKETSEKWSKVTEEIEHFWNQVFAISNEDIMVNISQMWEEFQQKMDTDFLIQIRAIMNNTNVDWNNREEVKNYTIEQIHLIWQNTEAQWNEKVEYLSKKINEMSSENLEKSISNVKEIYLQMSNNIYENIDIEGIEEMKSKYVENMKPYIETASRYLKNIGTIDIVESMKSLKTLGKETWKNLTLSWEIEINNILENSQSTMESGQEIFEKLSNKTSENLNKLTNYGQEIWEENRVILNTQLKVACRTFCKNVAFLVGDGLCMKIRSSWNSFSTAGLTYANRVLDVMNDYSSIAYDMFMGV